MEKQVTEMLPDLMATIGKIRKMSIVDERLEVLKPLIDYIQNKVDLGLNPQLNFICTHNSRRSQFSQIWAQTAADYFGVHACCYSGGVEVTAFSERAIASIMRSGFRVSAEGEANPHYSIWHSLHAQPILAFSKLFDDPANNTEQFAAIMTCAHADENCPFIPGTEKRIPVRYDDPKAFDNTPLEADKYDERSTQIASEMFYVFSNIHMD
jgi:arsenate reductase